MMAKGEIFLSFRAKKRQSGPQTARAATKAVSNTGMEVVERGSVASMVYMVAEMSDQGVKPSPVSSPRVLPSPPQKRAQDWRRRLYWAAWKERRSLSEMVVIVFTSSSLEWKTVGEGDRKG